MTGAEQISICLRHVDDDLIITEDFIGLYAVESTTGKSINKIDYFQKNLASRTKIILCSKTILWLHSKYYPKINGTDFHLPIKDIFQVLTWLKLPKMSF